MEVPQNIAMEPCTSQSSCEMTQEVANLEVRSETEKSTNQFSQIASEEVVDANSSQTEIADDNRQAMEAESSSSSGSSESTSESVEKNSSSSSDLSSSTSANETLEEPAKRKRKRKRRRKKKLATTIPPERPFLARYKKLKLMEPKILPKLHIRFDDECSPDIATSEYNLKPRIIQALIRNFSVLEDLKESSREKHAEDKPKIQEALPEPIVCLKPRIIKAILV